MQFQLANRQRTRPVIRHRDPARLRRFRRVCSKIYPDPEQDRTNLPADQNVYPTRRTQLGFGSFSFAGAGGLGFPPNPNPGISGIVITITAEHIDCDPLALSRMPAWRYAGLRYQCFAAPINHVVHQMTSIQFITRTCQNGVVETASDPRIDT